MIKLSSSGLSIKVFFESLALKVEALRSFERFANIYWWAQRIRLKDLSVETTLVFTQLITFTVTTTLDK
jgi:hypothetical protein